MPFRPILSAFQISTYRLAKFLVPILQSLTTIKYTIKDSFIISTEFVEQVSSSNLMGSLDIDSLFTNVPLEETIEICTSNIFKNNTVHGLKKANLKILYL